MNSNECWLVFDCEKKGSEKQCKSLANILSLSYQSKPIKKYYLLKLIPRVLWHFFFYTFKSLRHNLPKIIISSGSRASAIVPRIKKIFPQVKLVNILNPRLPFRWYDAIILPAHDGISANNVICTSGALHDITNKTIQGERNNIDEKYKQLQKPIITVLIGGKSKSAKSNHKYYTEIGKKIKEIHRQYNASFLISFSRRTGGIEKNIILGNLTNVPKIIYDGEGNNPYLTYLSVANYIIVTSDSISMVSEACATGSPIFIAEHDCMSKKFKRFYKKLYKINAARKFTGSLEMWNPNTLDERGNVKKRLIDLNIITKH